MCNHVFILMIESCLMSNERVERHACHGEVRGPFARRLPTEKLVETTLQIINFAERPLQRVDLSQ